MSVSIDRFVSGTFDLDLWIKLLQLRYDNTTQQCDQFIVGGINIFDSINSKRDIDSSYSNTEVNTALALKQDKLKNDSTIGYSVLGPDGKTVYSLEASDGIYLTPTFTMVNNNPSNYRIQIKVDELYTAQAQTYARSAAAAAVASIPTGTAETSGALTVNGTWSNTAGQINLTSAATGNYIAWNLVGLGPPRITTRSPGTKLVLYPGMATGQVDYAIGIDQANGGVLWSSVASTSAQHRWYCATTQVMNVNTTGLQMPAASTIAAANITVSGNLTVTGTITNAGIVSTPFWIAGKVNALGTVVTRRQGRYPFTCMRNSAGYFTISPDANHPFTDTNYLVQITVLSDESIALGRIPQSYFQTTSFSVYTYLNGVQADAAFMITVIDS
jgi:hypothetical protein